MLTDGVAEVLVGVILDPQFGQVLVLGSGGIFAEILSDSVSLLPPWNGAAIRRAWRNCRWPNCWTVFAANRAATCGR